MKLMSFVQQLKKRKKLVLFFAIAMISIFIDANHSACANETTLSTSGNQLIEQVPPEVTLELNLNQFIYVRDYKALVTDQYRVTTINVLDTEGRVLSDDAKLMDDFRVIHDEKEYILDIIYRAEGAREEEPVLTFPDPELNSPTELELTISPYGMTVAEYKKGFKTDIVIKDENGIEVEGEVLIVTGMRVFEDGKEYILTVHIATSEIIRDTTVGQYIGILTENGYLSIDVKDTEGNSITDESVVLQDGYIIEADLEVTEVKIVPPIHTIILDNRDFITVGEWKQQLTSNEIEVCDLLGNVTPDDAVIEDGFTAIIDGDEFKLLVNKNISQYEGSHGGENLEAPSGDVKKFPEEQDEPSQEELERIEKEKAEAKEKAEKEAKAKAEKERKIKAEAEAKIRAIIKAKADAQIKEERLAAAKALIKKAEVARIVMNQKFNNWQDAKKELSKVNKSAKAINIVKGKPDSNQVANALGQYQAISSKLLLSKKYRDVVITVSDAVEVFTKKKVNEYVIAEFVKKNIKTYKNVHVIINDLKKQKLKVVELEKYKLQLKKNETVKKVALSKKKK